MGHVHRVARAPRALSAAVALSLSALFVTVYGVTSWLTSFRTDVGTWSFAWERHLPLVPWLIVPYMSLDLFFVAAPFLCRDRTELHTFRRRMTATILVAGACFLLWPLQFAYPRPDVAGWAAPIFRALYGFDRPYNMFPSLHIAILMILAGTFDRHSNGLARWCIRGWFALIGLSTVLTWQHHLIDVGGGFALALCCCYLVPDEGTPQPVTRNSRIGVFYAGGAAGLAAMASWIGPWGLPFFWPAVAMIVVAGAYFGLYAAVGRKQGGRLSIFARVLLAPWLVGQRLSLLYYRRQANAWDEIVPGVWIGRRLNEREAAQAVAQGATAVLDLTAEFSEVDALLSLEYLNLQVLDLTAPSPAQLRSAVEFISTRRQAGPVFVHCKIGYSRSATVVGCWLLSAGLASTPEDAIARMRAARPSLVVRPEAKAALREFAARDRLSNAARTTRLIEART